jgi:hypothetical protein
MRRIIGSEQGRTDVVIPMDGVTRVPVRTGLQVQLWDPTTDQARPGRVVLNLSGQAAVLNEAADQQLTFRVLTGRTYYRGPVLVTFNPAQDGPTQVVALERRPDAPFDDVATLVRGVVVRSAGGLRPMQGVRVSAAVPSPGHQFPVTTDDRGAFALAVGLRPPGPDELPAVTGTLRFDSKGLPPRTLTVAIRHGRTHVFADPIDLDGTGGVPFHQEPDVEPHGSPEPDQ